MSRQFHFYLLPEDVESLIRTLRSRLGVCLFRPWSPSLTPLSTESGLCQESRQPATGTVRVDCYLAPKDAEIRMKFIRNLSRWIIDPASEVIEFSGCEFDRCVLVRGKRGGRFAWAANSKRGPIYEAEMQRLKLKGHRSGGLLCP